MTAFLFVIATVLTGSIAVGLVRIHKGPGAGDRMLAVQLFGTTGIAILLVLAIATGEAAAIDAALILALLAAVTGLALSRSGLDIVAPVAPAPPSETNGPETNGPETIAHTSSPNTSPSRTTRSGTPT